MTDKEHKAFRDVVIDACHCAGFLPAVLTNHTVELLFGPLDGDGIRKSGLEGWLREQGCRIMVMDRGSKASKPSRRFLANWYGERNAWSTATGPTEVVARGKSAASAVEMVYVCRRLNRLDAEEKNG